VDDHPYRPELVRVEGKRIILAEPEPAPLRVQVRAWSDGTTRLRLRSATYAVSRLGLSAIGLLFGVVAVASIPLGEWPFFVMVAVVPVLLMLHSFRGETISVSPAAVSRRRHLGRAEVRLLNDVSTVVVSGHGENTRVDLQVGQERLELAAGLGYDEKTLRWIAQRLQRALEAGAMSAG